MKRTVIFSGGTLLLLAAAFLARADVCTVGCGGAIPNGAVTTEKIADDAVTKEKIAADVCGAGLVQDVDGSCKANVDGVTVTINGSNQLEASGGGTGAIASLTSNFAPPINNDTTVTWQQEDFDNGSHYDLAGNPTRMTSGITGTCVVSCYVSWAANNTGSRQVMILKNGAIPNDAFARLSQQTTISIPTDQTVVVVDPDAQPTDYYECSVRHASTVAISVLATLEPKFTISCY